MILSFCLVVLGVDITFVCNESQLVWCGAEIYLERTSTNAGSYVVLIFIKGSLMSVY